MSRKEKEVHCKCDSTDCNYTKETSPLDCKYVRNGNCPVHLPCGDHENSPEGYREHLTSVIKQLIRSDDEDKQLVITIPCDSTDAWIVAAFGDLNYSCEVESIIDPWSSIISSKKEYHGIRVPGHKKSTSVYRKFMPQLSDNWDVVADSCKSARIFTDSIQLLQNRID